MSTQTKTYFVAKRSGNYLNTDCWSNGGDWTNLIKHATQWDSVTSVINYIQSKRKYLGQVSDIRVCKITETITIEESVEFP